MSKRKQKTRARAIPKAGRREINGSMTNDNNHSRIAEKDVRQSLAWRESVVTTHDTFFDKLGQESILWIYLIALCFSIFIGIFYTQSTDLSKLSLALQYICIAIILLHFLALSRLKRSASSKNKRSIDVNLWKLGQYQAIFRFTVSITFIALVSLGIKIIPIYTFYISVLCAISYMVYGISLMTILYRPSLFFNYAITGIGTGFHLLASVIFPVSLALLFRYYVNNDDILVRILGAGFGVYMISITLGCIGHIILFFREKLNFVQLEVLTIIPTDRIFNELRDKISVYRDQIDAIEAKIKIDRVLSKGAKSEFVKLILEENQWSKGKIIGVLLAILLPLQLFIVFIATSIGEGLVQDIFNERIKQWWGSR